MGRMALGSRQRRLVPGVAELVLLRHRRMDRAFCVAQFGDECWFCANVRALAAGQSVHLTGEDVYSALCDDEHLARTYRDLLDDPSVYVVGADTLERL